MNPLQPTASVLCKLGSIAVHVQEMFSATGHAFDEAATKQLIEDSEIAEWLAAMDKLAMIPRKRTMEDVKLHAKAARRQKGRA